ncbi:Uncharacterised protein g425 [Pycnogonum litorale]
MKFMPFLLICFTLAVLHSRYNMVVGYSFSCIGAKCTPAEKLGCQFGVSVDRCKCPKCLKDQFDSCDDSVYGDQKSCSGRLNCTCGHNRRKCNFKFEDGTCYWPANIKPAEAVLKAVKRFLPFTKDSHNYNQYCKWLNCLMY